MRTPPPLRHFLFYRDWSSFPDWFEPSAVDAADDESLGIAVDRYASANLASLPEAERQRQEGPEGSFTLRTWMESGDRGYLPGWWIFGLTESRESAAAVCDALRRKFGSRISIKSEPASGFSHADQLVKVRDVELVDAEIRKFEDAPLPLGMTRLTPMSTREKLRLESKAMARIFDSQPPADALEQKGGVKGKRNPDAGVARAKSGKAERPESVSLEFWAVLDDTKRRIVESLDAATRRGESRSIDELVKATHVSDPSTISRALKRLQRLGAVIHNPSSATGFSLGPVPAIPNRIERQKKRQTDA